MTIDQKINQLIILCDRCHDRRQQEALRDAVIMMQSVSELYIKAYMRGFRDGRIKEGT